MSADVVSLHGTGLQNVARQQFADAAAQAFDLYVETFGHEPEAFVHVMGGITQTTRVGWHTTGVSAAGRKSMLALAAMTITKEIVNPD